MFLSKPYPYLYNLKRNIIIASAVGILSIYLNHVRLNNDSMFFNNTIIPHHYISIIVGIIVALSVFIVTNIIPNLFFSNKLIDNWNIGNELLISIGVFVTIFFVNYIFFLIITKNNSKLLSISFFIKLTTYVITTGTLILSIILWVNYTLTLKRNLRHVEINNNRLEELLNSHKNEEIVDNIITLKSNLKNEVIEININKLQFIKSDGNYIEVYTIDNSEKSDIKLYRASLQTIEEELSKYDDIIKTHRSYIVNIKNISKTDGNARNYKLYFNGTEVTVPVSRSKFSEFNAAFQKIG